MPGVPETGGIDRLRRPAPAYASVAITRRCNTVRTYTWVTSRGGNERDHSPLPGECGRLGWSTSPRSVRAAARSASAVHVVDSRRATTGALEPHALRR